MRETVSELREDPDVAYAVPNYIARASFVPNDPDFRLQWNLNSPFGINAPAAWDLARARGVPGGKGRDRGGARHRRGLPALPALPARARPQRGSCAAMTSWTATAIPTT